MTFRLFILSFLTLSLSAFAVDRKPAVEDFVGIEIDQPATTPQGTESLFNFEKEITEYKEVEVVEKPTRAEAAAPSEAWGVFQYLTLTCVIGLPVLLWTLVLNHMRNKASIQNANNIEVLAKYRKEREEAKKAQDDKAA